MFVRWKDQETERDGQGRLPGYNEAVVRHFDAPEALDTRFYEVHAKSALNRVPAQSRMPFPWTINPYQGLFACVHICARGDTAVLMADGRTRELRHIRPGNRIYGTAMIGRYRRYVDHEGARPLDGAQARVSRDARERDGADHERRPPVALTTAAGST